MITLYHSMSARSFRPLWTLEEIGLPYRLTVLPFPPRVRRKDYLSINPLGTVPAFFDGDLRMTESAAICQYLASRYGSGDLDVGPQDRSYGEFLNWLHFGEATLTFPQTLVLRYGRFEPPDRQNPQVVEDYSRWFLARLRGVDAVIGDREFLSAGRFTVADISVGYALMLAGYLGLEERFPPAVTAYWHRLSRRPAYFRALRRQEEEAVAQQVPTTPAPQDEGANSP